MWFQLSNSKPISEFLRVQDVASEREDFFIEAVAASTSQAQQKATAASVSAVQWEKQQQKKAQDGVNSSDTWNAGEGQRKVEIDANKGFILFSLSVCVCVCVCVCFV